MNTNNKLKHLALLLACFLAFGLGACGGDTGTEEIKEETSEQTEHVKEKTEKSVQENPYEEIAKFAFGEDVKCEVVKYLDDDNKPKVTRINITDFGEPMVQPFLIDIFSY